MGDDAFPLPRKKDNGTADIHGGELPEVLPREQRQPDFAAG